MNGLQGLFKCYDHDVSFNDLDDFNQHIAGESHTHTGTNKCQDCGKPNQEIKFEGTLENGTMPPAICKNCEEKYIKELEAKGLVKRIDGGKKQ